ncbi:two-component system regulatory protein YycI [Paenibacillus sp. PR3]|uniref:Two-component system regulatory protein YycI n=1 Tax=Paenibacillus terricola TaxID=2763503 RepID=A0ABR8MWH4_9BACL|nr:two-component system regulatory protein YycI [Paenibacillus terricola]MBD3920321.1 two-component system regulatory protein YycI [Paenibacillus terricola]
MDWSRAKSVLILAFLLLNVVLGYQLWENVSERLNTGQKLGDLDADTLRMMKERGIGLATSASIPSETPELRDLTYRFKITGTAEEVTLEKPVDSRIIFDEKELIAQLGGVIPDLAEYQYDQLASPDGIFVLYRMAGGRPMFDVKLELFYSNQNQKITAYRQTQVELVDAEASEAHEVLPASKAIVPLVDKYLEEGSVIKEISLGYHGQLFNSETQYAAPSWRVLLENGKPFYVHAISAEVVQEKVEDTADEH